MNRSKILNYVLVVVLLFTVVAGASETRQNDKIVEQNQELKRKLVIQETELIELEDELNKVLEELNEYKNMSKYVLYDVPLTVHEQIMIQNKCSEFGFDFQWYLAMLRQESNYKNIVGAMNNNGTRDYGVAQLNERYHDWQAKLAGLDSYNIMDIEDNVSMSLAQLRWIENRYKLTDINAIYVYNVGSPKGNLTSAHTKKVTKYYNELNNLRIGIDK